MDRAHDGFGESERVLCANAQVSGHDGDGSGGSARDRSLTVAVLWVVARCAGALALGRLRSHRAGRIALEGLLETAP